MSEMRATKVTVRPATLNRFTTVPIGSKKKRRVAAYARVSTNSEEQATSYEAQVSYYTEHIKSNSEWKFVHVYTDKGITGTNTKKREGFNQMIEDALAGKIDLSITKSVSRFARNTVDSLTTIRKLKAQGIEVYFEEQNIYTLDSKGELMLTIMSSLAQEESRSISENVTWGQRKRFADGKVSITGFELVTSSLPIMKEVRQETLCSYEGEGACAEVWRTTGGLQTVLWEFEAGLQNKMTFMNRVYSSDWVCFHALSGRSVHKTNSYFSRSASLELWPTITTKRPGSTTRSSWALTKEKSSLLS